MKRSMSLVATILALLALALLSGCGGGGDDNNATGGTVTGRVLAGLDNPTGLGGVRVSLTTRTVPATEVASAFTDANGYYRIENVPPGSYNMDVEINPATGFVLPPGTQLPQVTVFDGQITEITQPIVIVDEGDVPPSPI